MNGPENSWLSLRLERKTRTVIYPMELNALCPLRELLCVLLVFQSSFVDLGRWRVSSGVKA